MSRIGITVSFLIFALAFIATAPAAPAVSAADVEVINGDLDGVLYRIQIPKKWNRGLVMYAHGYHIRGMAWSPMQAEQCKAFLERGFALAESGYSRQGWAVAEAVEETEALRRHFVKQHGEPESTFITGHSMGGLITIATIETYPDAYDGALPMCGPLVPAVRFFKDPVFDMLVTFEALFGEALPDEAKPVIGGESLPPQTVMSALESDAKLAEDFASHWGMRSRDLPQILWLYHTIYRELVKRAGGNPVDNRNTVYFGFGSAPELNAAVPRYAADPDALAYLRRHYTPTGVVSDPVLAVHTSYDPGVPPRLANGYGTILALSECDKWFVHQFVEAEGHCNISPELMGKAFDQLRKWAAEGERPEAGLLN